MPIYYPDAVALLQRIDNAELCATEHSKLLEEIAGELSQQGRALRHYLTERYRLGVGAEPTHAHRALKILEGEM